MGDTLALIPGRLAKAYEDRTSLNLGEAARALEMDEKLLRAAVDRGKIKYVLRGQGTTRKLRRFLLTDLVDYLNAERRLECPSTYAPARRSTGASSGSTVYDIDILRAKRKSDRLGSPKSA